MLPCSHTITQQRNNEAASFHAYTLQQMLSALIEHGRSYNRLVLFIRIYLQYNCLSIKLPDSEIYLHYASLTHAYYNNNITRYNKLHSCLLQIKAINVLSFISD